MRSNLCVFQVLILKVVVKNFSDHNWILKLFYVLFPEQ
jgi:hypothetical protein